MDYDLATFEAIHSKRGVIMVQRKNSSQTCILVLGDQLFPEHCRKIWGERRHVFMAESWDLCEHFRYHKQKILLFLASMRNYCDELESAGYSVTYWKLDQNPEKKSFLDLLANHIRSEKITSIGHFQISDRFFEEKIKNLCREAKVQRVEFPSPGFLTSRDQFKDYVERHKKPKMQSFYQEQRIRLDVLMDKDKPRDGKWSFDTENRKKLPAKLLPPKLPRSSPNKHLEILKPNIEKWFHDHPGSLDTFIWPVTRRDALRWLESFLSQRFELFGPYEDAIAQRFDFIFHSALSPILNIGLLTPAEILDQTLRYSEKNTVILPSLEGFIRQLIGWREFIFGIDRNFGVKQYSSNFFGHRRRLTCAWYDGTTGLYPLDYSIQKSLRLGYVHHIERLMIISNIMLLCEINPHDAYQWFMELFVDSADWVMGPNVFGMGQFSDGGIFATKPYIAGSNYILKMSDFEKGPWCEVMDGLYWRFIGRHRDFFAAQPRLSMMCHMLDKIPRERLNSITKAAENFLRDFTKPS
jgi:deoxyribodipyrimidine photolyase-related protein